MKIQTTRFILSVMGVIVLTALAFYAMFKGDAVSPPICISGIMTIVGGYQWGKTVNNSKFIESQNNESIQK